MESAVAERLTLTVQIGDAMFTADGSVDVILPMYRDWLNTLNGCDCEIPEPADPCELPVFRTPPPIGRA